MALAPIYNPPVPFKGYLPMAPHHGASILISGTPHGWSRRFSVNLETDNGDMALHFNPRFEGMNEVIRNTRIAGSWGVEEKAGYFPFVAGQSFEITIQITQYGYEVSVNGQHFCRYNHRIPKEYIRHLSIEGDVQVGRIQFNSATAQPPAPAPVPVPTVYNPVPVAVPVYTPTPAPTVIVTTRRPAAGAAVALGVGAAVGAALHGPRHHHHGPLRGPRGHRRF